MTQRRYLNYLEDDSTDLLNRRLLGSLREGVYCGFDIDPTVVTGTSLILDHAPAGHVEVDVNLNYVAASGFLLTKQGVVIKEGGTLSFPINANPGANWRIDTIVVTHEHVLTSGGAAGVYSVIQGTAAATPVPAALTEPEKQTVVGYLHLSPAWASFADPVHWVKSCIPTHEELTLKSFQGATYVSVSKRLDIAPSGNLHKFSTSGTNEVQNIGLLNYDSKLLILFAETACTFVTGGNILLASNLNVGAETFISLISDKLDNGQVVYRILNIYQGNVAYLNVHNNYTKTNSNAQTTLSVHLADDFNTVTGMLLIKGNGNAVMVNMVSGYIVKGFRSTDSLELQDGTELSVLFKELNPGDTMTLDLTVFAKPKGITANSLEVTEGDLIKVMKLSGVWYIDAISNTGTRLKELEDTVAFKGSPSSFPFSALVTGLTVTPSGVARQLYYKDAFNRVHFTGRALIATTTIFASTVLFTLQAGYRPPNNSNNLGFVFVNATLVDAAGIDVKAVLLRIDPVTGEVLLLTGEILTNEILDLRTISFLAG